MAAIGIRQAAGAQQNAAVYGLEFSPFPAAFIVSGADAEIVISVAGGSTQYAIKLNGVNLCNATPRKPSRL